MIDGAFDVDSSVLFLFRVRTRLVCDCPLRCSRLDVNGLERPRRGRCIILVFCDGERPRRGRSLIRAFIVVVVRAIFFLLSVVIVCTLCVPTRSGCFLFFVCLVV